MPFLSSAHRRGFSLVEISIVLGLVGLIFSLVWTLAPRASQTAKIEQATEAIASIVSATRQAYAAKGNITGDMTVVMPYLTNGVSGGAGGTNAFPSYLLSGTGSGACATFTIADSPWKGDATGCGSLRVCSAAAANDALCVQSSKPNPAGASFAIAFTSLTSTVCTSFATQITSTTPAAGLTDVYVNGCSAVNGTDKKTSAACSGTATKGLPVSISFAQTLCAATNPASIDLIYSLRAPTF